MSCVLSLLGTNLFWLLIINSPTCIVLIDAPDELDHHHWRLQSLIINHDHTYCRPSCLEPSVLSRHSKTMPLRLLIHGLISKSVRWTPLMRRDQLRTTSSTNSPDFVLSHLRNPRSIIHGSPMRRSIFNITSFLLWRSSHIRWNTTIDRCYLKMRKGLHQMNFESSIRSGMVNWPSQFQCDCFRLNIGLMNFDVTPTTRC